jgi:hypothetical protein
VGIWGLGINSAGSDCVHWGSAVNVAGGKGRKAVLLETILGVLMISLFV